MDLREAMDIVGLSNENEPLPTNRKMPGPSYDLPAHACKRGAVLAHDRRSMCHPKTCYAKRGWFRAPWVKEGLERRLASIGRPAWAEAFGVVLRTKYATIRHFRWHASGDLQSANHLRDIIQVARLAPWMKFWLPSHEPAIVEEVLRSRGFHELPDNLTIRISADRLYEFPELVDISLTLRQLQFSMVHEVFGQAPKMVNAGWPVFECRSHERGNECGGCRVCWSNNPALKVVSYPRTTSRGVIRSAQLRILP